MSFSGPIQLLLYLRKKRIIMHQKIKNRKFHLPFRCGTEPEDAFFFIICKRLSAVPTDPLLDTETELELDPRFKPIKKTKIRFLHSSCWDSFCLYYLEKSLLKQLKPWH